MRSYALFVLFLMGFGLFLPAATAQEAPQISLDFQPGEGLYDSLRRNGCDPGWLSAVMESHHITVERLRQLWRPIGVDHTECVGTPDEATVARTMQVLEQDSQARGQRRQIAAAIQSHGAVTVSSGSKNIKPSISTEHSDSTDGRTRMIADMSSTISQLNGTNTDLVAQRDEAKRALASETRERLPILIATAGVTAAIFMALFFWFWHRESRRGRIVEGSEGFLAIDKRNGELERLVTTLSSQVFASKRVIDGLQTEKQGVENRLAEVSDLYARLQDGCRTAISFDRQIVITSNGEEYIFHSTGCFPNSDGTLWFDHFACPLCPEKHLVAPNGEEHLNVKFAHLQEKCPGMRSLRLVASRSAGLALASA